MATKRALIIGINTYLYMEEKYQLKGCVNDAKLMHSVLVHKFNFPPENILLLLDENATLAAIHAAMEELVQSLEQDDIFVFHFSGHGGDCTIHDAFTDEGTGKDNCILPCDDSEIGPDGKEIYREVRDQQFSDYLARIAEKTVYTTLIFDACYSGTMTRSAFVDDAAKDRFIPQHVRQRAGPVERNSIELRSVAELQHQAEQNLRPQTDAKGAGGWLTRSDSYTVIAASRDTQKAKEWHFDIGNSTVRHGLLSFFLARSLMRAKALSTYRDVFETVCAGVVSMVTEQNPQIEGAIDREVFGVKEIEPLDFVLVTSIEANTITLGGGGAQGLQVGAKYKLYPVGNKTADEEDCLGIAKIKSVAGLSSQAEILEQVTEILPGMRCVEFESVKAAQPFTVNVGNLDNSQQSSVTSKLNHSKLLKAVYSSKGAQASIRLCESQAQLNEWLEKDAAQHINQQQNDTLSYPIWLVLEQQGTLAMRSRAVADSDSLDVIVSNLEKLAKFRNVMQLNNPRSKLKVEFNLYRLNEEHNKVLVNGGSSEFAEHELMSIQLKNKASSGSVFFTIFWIGADKQIMHFYPRNRSCEELKHGHEVRIGNLRSKLAASLPENHFADTGSITWKIMFSSVETDFGPLSQTGMRSAQHLASLEAFDIAFTGEAAPSHTEHEQERAVVEHDWCAINRSVVLKKAGH